MTTIVKKEMTLETPTKNYLKLIRTISRAIRNIS